VDWAWLYSWGDNTIAGNGPGFFAAWPGDGSMASEMGRVGTYGLLVGFVGGLMIYMAAGLRNTFDNALGQV
jgi:hypothetical protein